MSLSSILQKAADMDPIWFLVIVNIIALFVGPLLAYKYAHKNNIKLLKDKWIAQVRSASVQLLQASEELFLANSDLCATVKNGQPLVPPETRTERERAQRNAQSKFYGARGEIRLLFKADDKKYPALQNVMDSLQRGADNISSSPDGGHMYMDNQKRLKAEKEFVDHVNSLLHEYWDEITET